MEVVRKRKQHSSTSSTRTRSGESSDLAKEAEELEHLHKEEDRPGEEEIIKCVGVEINYTEETEQSRSEKRLRKSYNLYFFPLLEEILYQRVWH